VVLCQVQHWHTTQKVKILNKVSELVYVDITKKQTSTSQHVWCLVDYGLVREIMLYVPYYFLTLQVPRAPSSAQPNSTKGFSPAQFIQELYLKYNKHIMVSQVMLSSFGLTMLVIWISFGLPHILYKGGHWRKLHICVLAPRELHGWVTWASLALTPVSCTEELPQSYLGMHLSIQGKAH
jgi:hypothetical protein